MPIAILIAVLEDAYDAMLSSGQQTGTTDTDDEESKAHRNLLWVANEFWSDQSPRSCLDHEQDFTT